MNTGGISVLVLVFGVVFSLAISGLVLITATQYVSSTRTEAFEKALTVAQAGADYYRWHLAHNPTDFTDGTGQPGPYMHEFTDPYGNASTFSLTIDSPASGSSLTTITSQGWVNAYPDVRRTVRVKYGIPSIAKYAFLHNANVWFGSKITIHGKIFSNGGIRMDGTHDSTVQSAKETYTCGSETGCSTPTTKPGVWGDGGPQDLWEFPVTPVDFNSIAADFNTLKTSAIDNGTYLGPSNAYGYHLVFTSNGSYEIRKVTGAQNKRGWSVEKGCENLYQKITQETILGTYQLSSRSLIFAEDHVWIDGVVNGKGIVVAARFPLEVNSMNIWINNNLTYTAKDNSNNLGIVAQNNIIFPLSIPQIYEINAALLAQKGRIIRHNYRVSSCAMEQEAVRQELIIYGALISNQKSYWNYGQGNAGFGSQPASGFSHRDITYDANLFFNPPPYFPSQGEYEFISWEEY
ncbi:hypothetical protein HY408_00600 [Candidatus Gottesmanbacteria bacterium]|nr:hypothetical protein [Candidatus Gottesmanbacteria bacterium]